MELLSMQGRRHDEMMWGAKPVERPPMLPSRESASRSQQVSTPSPSGRSIEYRVASFQSKRSPDGAQRNPGFSRATQQPRISLRFIRATAPSVHLASILTGVPVSGTLHIRDQELR